MKERQRRKEKPPFHAINNGRRVCSISADRISTPPGEDQPGPLAAYSFRLKRQAGNLAVPSARTNDPTVGSMTAVCWALAAVDHQV